MKITLKCIECGLNNFLKLMEKFNIEEKKQFILTKEFLLYLSSMDYSLSPPVMSKYSHEMIRKLLDNKDPYIEQKKFYNKKIMGEYEKFKEIINATDDPLRSAFILSIAGNIIDFGPNENFDIEKTIKEALNEKIVIDNYNNMLSDLKKSSLTLYMLDNAGEIVFDKLFIEELIKNNIVNSNNIIAVTRGYPIINDTTMEDAEETGLTKVVKVIHTGDDTPGIVLKTSSEEFQKYLKKTDLIISKGQGNFETLQEVNNKNIYFLFIAKCPTIAETINVPIKSFICMNKGK